MSQTITKKKTKLQKMSTGEWVFYLVVITIPVINIILFYFGQNINNFLVAFKTYDYDNGVYYYDGLVNFKNFFDLIFNSPLFLTAMKNQLIIGLIGYASLIPSLFISYYISRNFVGSKFFTVFFMLPSMVSGVVWAIIFKNFAEVGLPILSKALGGSMVMGPLTTVDTRFWTILIYAHWIGFGGGMLIFSSSMSAINPSVLEAARIDGVSVFQEFWHIVMPSIYPTFTVMMITSIAGFFTGQLNGVYEMYGLNADESLYTVGYFMFATVMKGGGYEYTLTAAGSFIFTLIVAPVTFLVKTLMEKYGPSED